MSMSANILALELQNLLPTSDEDTAIQRIVDAYAIFASDAEALTPILSTGIDLGKEAMIPALVGISIPNNGAIAWQTGVIAFWNAVALGLTLSFSGATTINPPTGNSSLETTLQPVFDNNTITRASIENATEDMANVIQTAAIVGGFVTTPGPITTPII